VRRFVIASLPFVAAAVVVTLVLGSRSPVHHAVATASARPTKIAYRPPLRPRHEFRLPPAPAQLRGAAARRAAIPILTYHVVGTPAPGVPYPQLWVSPPVFAAEMAALRRAGYWGITLAQAWRAWTRGGSLPRRPVVVSFDDGYRGDYTHARPVLRRLGWPGLLNLELDNVHAGNLRASEVRGLIRSGWEIASHTIDHPDLTTVSAARVRYELTASLSELRRRFGVRTDFFCYPYGHYNATVEAAVRAAGYRAATTEDEGWATPAAPFALRRVRVDGSDTAATLLARLAAERPPS
jgi:peptidoglycan/xylan/chitin deacetylase (PgdA/CDA1 family)